MSEPVSVTETTAFKIQLDVIPDTQGGGGGTQTLKVLPRHSPVVVASAAPLVTAAVAPNATTPAYSERFVVAFAYAIPNLAELVPSEIFNVVTDSVELAVITQPWTGFNVPEASIVAKTRVAFSSTVTTSASDAGTVITPLDSVAGSPGRQWCVLIRAVGSTRTDGSVIAPHRQDVAFIQFPLPRALQGISRTDVLSGGGTVLHQ